MIPERGLSSNTQKYSIAFMWPKTQYLWYKTLIVLPRWIRNEWLPALTWIFQPITSMAYALIYSTYVQVSQEVGTVLVWVSYSADRVHPPTSVVLNKYLQCETTFPTLISGLYQDVWLFTAFMNWLSLIWIITSNFEKFHYCYVLP